VHRGGQQLLRSALRLCAAVALLRETRFGRREARGGREGLGKEGLGVNLPPPAFLSPSSPARGLPRAHA